MTAGTRYSTVSLITTRSKRSKIEKLDEFRQENWLKDKWNINERIKFEKKKQEKNIFYVEICLLLIFAQFTTYFRIH